MTTNSDFVANTFERFSMLVKTKYPAERNDKCMEVALELTKLAVATLQVVSDENSPSSIHLLSLEREVAKLKDELEKMASLLSVALQATLPDS